MLLRNTANLLKFLLIKQFQNPRTQNLYMRLTFLPKKMQSLNSVMSVQSFNFYWNPFHKTPPNNRNSVSTRNSRAHYNLSLRCFSELTNIADVLHNKVLVAAAVSGAIGQLSKPITSTLFYGKKFDLKAAFQAGGFPSTHSSAAVATATSLGLERGFSDAIFGLAVVYAGLIMYDAQGVRREVGTHAKELNKVLLRSTTTPASSRNDVNELPNSFSRESSRNLENIDTVFLEEQSSFQTKPKGSSVLLRSDNKIQSSSFVRSNGAVSVKEGSETVAYGQSPLKESIGHTEIEVAAGAFLGFLVSLAIFPYV